MSGWDGAKMKYEMIIFVFFSGITGTVILYINDLVFGNEATGLPEYLLNVDESVVIRHSKNIDSLNLPISVAMAIYEFSKKTIFN